MSRSNQTEIVNPAVRFMEWSGEKGQWKFWDKTVEQRIELDPNITFLLLDQMATVKGWHDASESGIYANEVKDISKDTLTVKAFKGGVIAQGFYKDIKDKVAASGGRFTASIYIGLKIDNELRIANLQLRGAALNAWIDFAKKHRGEIYKKAIHISHTEEGKKGAVTFRTPAFTLKEVSPETDNIAKALDLELQTYFKAYLKKPQSEQVESIQQAPANDAPPVDKEPAWVGQVDTTELPF